MNTKLWLLIAMVLLTVAIVAPYTVTFSEPVSTSNLGYDRCGSTDLMRPCGDDVNTPGPSPLGQNKT